MTIPLFGYDTSLPQQIGLYRMLAAQLVIEGTQRGIILNQSSALLPANGIEDLTVTLSILFVGCERHLPLRCRLGWQLLRLLVNRIAIPLLKQYKL